jgi:hypothetical protein
MAPFAVGPPGRPRDFELLTIQGHNLNSNAVDQQIKLAAT